MGAKEMLGLFDGDPLGTCDTLGLFDGDPLGIVEILGIKEGDMEGDEDTLGLKLGGSVSHNSAQCSSDSSASPSNTNHPKV